MKAPTLFPEMEAEIRMDRIAERRESKQRAREFLARNGGYQAWILSQLATGEKSDAWLLLEMLDLCGGDSPGSGAREAATVLAACAQMWVAGELVREEMRGHPSGEQCYIYRLAKL